MLGCRWAESKAYIIEGSWEQDKKGARSHASQPQHRQGGGGANIQTHNRGNARMQVGRRKKHLYEQAWRAKAKLRPYTSKTKLVTGRSTGPKHPTNTPNTTATSAMALMNTTAVAPDPSFSPSPRDCTGQASLRAVMNSHQNKNQQEQRGMALTSMQRSTPGNSP